MKCPERVPSKQIHLIGIACLMIASKNEEVAVIKLKTFLEDIAHGKFSKSQLL